MSGARRFRTARLGLIAVAAPDSDSAVRRCEELAASVNVRMARE